MVTHSISLPLKNLFFEINQYQIKNSSYSELDRLVELVKKYELHINIGGHTDNVGAQKSNIELSQHRANSVRNYLIEKGCNRAKIKVKGYGEIQPVANNKTAEGREKNRRVEVCFYK
jgi:OOP family OmpA-OmpF porin